MALDHINLVNQRAAILREDTDYFPAYTLIAASNHNHLIITADSGLDICRHLLPHHP
jgi:hypothetical protein